MRVLIGDETGLLKSVALEGNTQVTLCSASVEQNRLRGIQRLCWKSASHSAVIARADASIECYDISENPDKLEWKFDMTPGKCVGLDVIHASNDVLRATEQGIVEMYRTRENKLMPIAQAASGMERMRLEPIPLDSQMTQNHFALGGKQRDLQVWSIETQQILFRAQNVKHDSLDLQVPVWIKDMHFLESNTNGHRLVVGTKYGHIRLYDTHAQRRPVQSFDLEDYSVNAMCVDPNGTLLYIADTTGHVDILDLRTLTSLGRCLGPSGAVRDIACHPTLPFMATVGLDRMVHVFNTATRKCEYSVYAKQRLNAILFCQDESQDEHLSKRMKKRRLEILDEKSEDEDEQPFDDLELSEEDSASEQSIHKANSNRTQ